MPLHLNSGLKKMCLILMETLHFKLNVIAVLFLLHSLQPVFPYPRLYGVPKLPKIKNEIN